MSAHIDTMIFCDGANGGMLKNDFSCPMDGPYAEGDARTKTAAQQRATYKLDGWVYRNGKDYCPDCAKRLGYAKVKP